MTPNDRRKARQAKDQRNRCWYCHLPLREDMTWEHLVAQAHGGSDKISNLRICHAKCNSLVGTLPYQLKLGLHEIGRDLGSDAFFLLAQRLKSQANAHHDGCRRSRRPKRPPVHVMQSVVVQLRAHLPPELFTFQDGPTRIAA